MNLSQRFSSPATRLILAVVGCILGAVAGHFVFWICLRYGFYGPSVIGLTVGYGSILLNNRGSTATGVVAAAVALLGMMISEGMLRPIIAHPGVINFILHFHEIANPVNVGLYLLGIAAAFFIARGRR